MPLHHLTRFPRLELIGAPTPLEYLPRLSDYLGREIYIKRDDVSPLQWAVINCVSWSFWWPTRCEKGRIR